MAENSVEHGQTGLLTVIVKTPREKHSVEVKEGASVRELKQEIEKKFNAPVEQLCVIFAGKIIKDEETLEQHGIKNGTAVHLVIKSPNRTVLDPPENPASRSTSTGRPDVSQTPFNLGELGGLAGLSNLGMGSANFMEMQQRLQHEMLSNPDMMRQLMDNPFIQSMMSNPDIMRSLLVSNPQMRELMERNPEITHMLNNPELLRQTMELARNPAMLQELMRSHDRAMSNLESIPGGFNALQRMYQDIQEPMLHAAQETVVSNPFASLINGSSAGENAQQGRENTDPLPNPWGGAVNVSNSTTTAGSTPAGIQNLTAGMFSSPGMQSLMQQISQNPQVMSNMLQSPYMQSVMQTLSSNPELAHQVIGNNPLFAGDPQIHEILPGVMPTLLQQMQTPEIQNTVTNPRALEAVMQIQRGLTILQQESPDLFSGLTGLTIPATTGITTPVATESTTTTAGQQDIPTTFSSALTQMMEMLSAGHQNQPPEQRYASQLQQLATMGFVDREANIEALTATFGDVNAAIDMLLQRR